MLNLFITFRLIDALDILLVASLMYLIFRHIRGTVGMNIFFGVIAFYITWLIVRASGMILLSSILGQFISVGVLVLIILFKDEIRQFLIVLGNRYFFKKQHFKLEKLMNVKYTISQHSIEEIIDALSTMSASRTGALIVVSPNIEFDTYMQTGVEIDAKVNSNLLQSIFYKNSPLHDGAVFIVGNNIRAAKCILPTTTDKSLPAEYGLRHRSAIAMSNVTNALILVVSEENGNVSYCLHGKITKIDDPQKLSLIIHNKLRGSFNT
ncbi:MAG: diadenylate cyclase [Bacteroidetes bacterium]|nr:diadenylate cyclase [Bacteroidota bacterium]